MGTLLGPVIGALVWLTLEELLASASFGLPGRASDFLHEHWLGLLGIFVVVVALSLKEGLYGWVAQRDKHHKGQP